MHDAIAETPTDINILLGKLTASVELMRKEIGQIDKNVDALKNGINRVQITCREFELCKENHGKYEVLHNDDQKRLNNIENILKDYTDDKEKIARIYAQNQYIKIVLGVMWGAILLFVTLIQQGILMVEI